MYLLELSPIVSNVLGYFIGVSISFILHRMFTFRSKGKPFRELVRFLIVFIVAFSINLLILNGLLKFTNINVALNQVISSFFYIVISYGMNKYFVFELNNAKQVVKG
jgi:putative flippase GtrA